MEEPTSPKAKEKRYASGRYRCRQTPNRRPVREGVAHIDKRFQDGHRICDTVIGASHKQAIVTMVKRKKGYFLMAKLSNMKSELVGSGIIQVLNPFEAKFKTLNCDNGKEFSRHAESEEALWNT